MLSVMSADVNVDRGTSHTCITRTLTIDECVRLGNRFFLSQTVSKTYHLDCRQPTCTDVGIFEGNITIKLHLIMIKGFNFSYPNRFFYQY